MTREQLESDISAILYLYKTDFISLLQAVTDIMQDIDDFNNGKDKS